MEKRAWQQMRRRVCEDAINHAPCRTPLQCLSPSLLHIPSATVPRMNARISSYCDAASFSLTRSILFCNMRMCFSFMISTAAKCSDVCGCGHDSLPAISSSAASITAAPFNIVAIKIS
jgi:hypothetical protein